MLELEILPQSRIDRRKLKFDFKKGKINQQYSYTTFEAISAEFQKRGSFDWLPSKEGQSIDQWWLVRIGQQKNASSYTKPIPMGCFGIHGNTDTELDDKLREYICDSKYHLDVNYEGGNEWILTSVSDIYKKLNFYPSSVDEILKNEEFMELWFERIESSKKKYFEDNTILSKVYNLKEWQTIAVREMIISGKKYHILGLATRFGKTLTVLDYSKQKVLNGDYSREELWIVPASKSLSSNASFVNDYNDFGFIQYFNIIKNTSLFVEEDKVIERLKKLLPINAKIILVTDEGDLASHTPISVEKINLIKSTFNVVEQIVMTGTGIGKATKIFRNVSIEDINQQYVPYSDMVEMGGEVVRRNFINVEYDIEKDFEEQVLNIRQSVDDAGKHPQLAKYIGDWTVNESVEARYGLQPTEIVMIFIKPSKNKYLSQLVSVYERMYSEYVKCLVLTGSEGADNREAQNIVKDTFNTMRKNKDFRKLIVFSAGIGSRSFSVSKIYRLINFSDSELTAATLQEFGRPLTYEDGKEVADIIRIGFTPLQLAEQLYLMENEIPSYDRKSNASVRLFLKNNSFSKLKVFKDSEECDGSYETMGNGIDDVATFIDELCKFADTESYLTVRLSGENLVVDTEPDGLSKKTKTKVVSTTPSIGKKIKTVKSSDGKAKLIKDDERRLKKYVNILRCIPYISKSIGITDIDTFLESGNWEIYLPIDKGIFIENYQNSEELRGIVDTLFRQVDGKTDIQMEERLIEYTKYVS